MSEKQQLDVEMLVAALKAQKDAQGLSWRQLASSAEVSPSTLTRMQQGKLPDVNTFTALTRWLKMPAETFTHRSKDSKHSAPHPLAVASTLLRGKKEWSPEAADALQELVKAAFKLAKELK